MIGILQWLFKVLAVCHLANEALRGLVYLILTGASWGRTNLSFTGEESDPVNLNHCQGFMVLTGSQVWPRKFNSRPVLLPITSKKDECYTDPDCVNRSKQCQVVNLWALAPIQCQQEPPIWGAVKKENVQWKIAQLWYSTVVKTAQLWGSPPAMPVQGKTIFSLWWKGKVYS